MFGNARRVCLERRDFLKSAAVGVTATAIATPAIAQTSPALRWRLISRAGTSPGVADAIDIFARELASLTGGGFEIERLPRGAPGNPAAIAFDLAASGAVDIAHGAASDCFGKNPAFAIGSGIPYGLSGRRQSDWLFQGGGTEALNAFFRNYNVHALPLGSFAGAPMGGWYRKEIRSPDDLRGLKVNIDGLAGMVMARLGVVLQALPPGEVAGALASGTIDGAEWPLPQAKPGARLARFRYGPGLIEGGSLHLFINLDSLTRLPRTYMMALVHAAVYADRWEEARAAALARAAMKAPSGGQDVRLRAWPVPVLKATEEAARDLYAELSAGNPDFRGLLGRMMAFRDDAFLSWQVAQYSREIDPFTAAL
jgi:TRAP-type mannitol/chloroaromatic compound transport system substrate-binding protein